MKHIATITHSQAKSGLNLKKAVELFVGDVKGDSGQDIFPEPQDDGSVYVFCDSNQDVEKTVQSMQRMKSYLGTHFISYVKNA